MAGRGIDMGDVVLRRAASKNHSSQEVEEKQVAPAVPYEDSVNSSTEVEDSGSAPEKTAPRRNRADGIRSLRGVRKSSSATLFNVALDEPLKNRLERASFEHKVPQTVIVRAAIEEFLRANGC